MSMIEFLHQLYKRPASERYVPYVFADGKVTKLQVVFQPPASDESIEKLDQLSIYALTPAYKQFLKQYNGVSFQFDDGYQHFEILSAEDAFESQKSLMYGLTSGEAELLPFASIMGEYIFLDLTRSERNVFFGSGA